MDAGDGLGDDEPTAGWISPDDRLWRHPSEVIAPPARGRRKEPRLWAVAALAGLIASMLTAGMIVAAGGFNRTVVQSAEVSAPLATSASSQYSLFDTPTHVEEIAERLRPSIVQIDVETASGVASGSGVVFRTDGHILTSEHVIAGAKSVMVETADGRAVAAKVIGSDKDTDIAVVKVEGIDAVAAPLGSATKLKVGQMAIAIGEPLGLAGGPTVTLGVVSAVGRQVDRRGGSLLDMIQTDAPIAPGSSGGALVDAGGAVIGITTAIAVTDIGAEGLGFATPIDIARDVAHQLIATGRVVHVWLGIDGEDLDHDRADKMNVAGGAVVKGVRGDSPASNAGISASDIITDVDGRPVTSMAALVVALRARRPGDSVKLTVRRDGAKPRQVMATLVERPASLR